MSARALLGPDGPLARLPSYEHRVGQLAMAEAVERTLADDRILLCEAGTGTGKTLAYLVPALASGRKVVVSTATKALQEQIAHQDLPLVQQELGVSVDAAVVKGLGNYLCLRRYHELGGSFALGARSKEVARGLPIVERWARETKTGDRAELGALEESHPIWGLVTSSSETRIGPRCEHFDACHVTRVKRAAEAARLVVVNHHLLFADLAVKGAHPGGVLPDYDALIIDEAHRLEDIATGFFGATVSSGTIERLFADAERSLFAAMLHDRAEPPGWLATARNRAEEMLAALHVAVPSSEDARVPLPATDGLPGVRDRYHDFDDALSVVAQIAGGHGAVSEALAQIAGRTAKLREDLAAILYPARARVAWIDRRGRSLTLSASPVDVGPILRERLFARGMGTVLTSATLTAGGSFSFLRARLGLDQPLDTPVDELVVEHALDYAGRALLYTPDDLPEVDAPAFAESAAERLAELIRMTPGGAFVLCTSVRAMRALSARVAALVPERMTMVQGDAPKRTLIERFRKGGDAVLVATASFWEGVDVPGRALSLVAIDRLPFDVPGDPLVSARCEAIRERGGSPFADYSVPRAAIALQQGFGRLLRTRADRGVVAILDRRVVTKPYGRTLLDGLPPAHRTRALSDVLAFWRAS